MSDVSIMTNLSRGQACKMVVYAINTMFINFRQNDIALEFCFKVVRNLHLDNGGCDAK